MRFKLFVACATMGFLACNAPKNQDEVNKIEEQVPVETGMQMAEKQHAEIEAYAKKKGLNGEFTPSGLYVAITQESSGEFPNAMSVVRAEYVGYMLDGSVFDASQPGSPIEFGLNQVVPGWTEGLQKFKKGSKGTLILPSNLGYGERSSGPIPANSVLAFDITLVDFK